MVCKTGQAALIGRLSVLNEYYLCECLFGGCDFGDGGSFLGETPFPFLFFHQRYARDSLIASLMYDLVDVFIRTFKALTKWGLVTRKIPYIFNHRYNEYKDRSGEVYDAKVLMDDVLSYAPPNGSDIG